jgi:hypothetical protein
VIQKNFAIYKNGFFGVALLTVSLAPIAHAYESIYDRSPSTEDILNHRNRKLEPPPKNIKSDRFDPSERFEVALARSENAVSLSTTEDAQSSSSGYEVLLGTNRKIKDKSVTLGVIGGGLSGLLAVRGEFTIPSIIPVWLSAFIGSGVDYTTWGFGVRKYLFPRLAILPFVDLRYSEWLLKQADSADAAYPFPAYATTKFFKNSYAKQTARLVSPGLGMAYLGHEGYSLEVGAQYSWAVDADQGALLGSLGLVKYF